MLKIYKYYATSSHTTQKFKCYFKYLIEIGRCSIFGDYSIIYITNNLRKVVINNGYTLITVYYEKL
jgi:hypothetical protein